MPNAAQTFEAAKARVESGDFSFEAMAAMVVSHTDKLVADMDRLDRRGTVESLAPTLFAHRGAGLAVVLTWDRAGLRHVETVFDYRTVGRTRAASDGWRTKLHVIDWSTFASNGAA